MKHLAILAAAALLTACHPVPTERPTAPAPKNTSSERVVLQHGTWKFCDKGRAVYVVNRNGTGIAVVENAPECSAAAS